MHFTYNTPCGICKNIQSITHWRYIPELIKTAFIISDELNLESEQITTVGEKTLRYFGVVYTSK